MRPMRPSKIINFNKEVKIPNFDGTGPFGDGRQGRGLGNCGRSAKTQTGLRQFSDHSIWGNSIILIADIINKLISKKPKNLRR